MTRANQNKELDIILNINGNSPGLRIENDIEFTSSFVSQGENNSFHLESYNAPLSINLPIFEIQEKEKLNDEIKDEKSPTEERELYIIKKKLNNLNLTLKNPFIILNKKKKRGRAKQKRKQEGINENEDNNNKIHDKNRSDNLLTKIQVHFIKFIVQFLNEILCHLKYKQKFSNINYKFKKNVKKEFVKYLKTQTIGDIICTQKSNKYKKVLNENKNIYEQTKENKVLSKIYSENYVTFFRKIYFKSERIINLRAYGGNEKIILTDKARMFKDIIKDQEYVYKKILINCVYNNFMPYSLLFETE